MFCKKDQTLLFLIVTISLFSTSVLKRRRLVPHDENGKLWQLYKERLANFGRKYFLHGSVVFAIGFVVAWPVSNGLGRKRGVIFSNILRTFAFLAQLVAIIFHAFSYHNKINFFWAAKILEELYAGLMAFLGPLYVYELLPDRPTIAGGTICAASGLSLYFLFATIGEYFVLTLLASLDSIHDSHVCCWIPELFLFTFTLVQTYLCARYFPESPSYLALQRKNKGEAKVALSNLREIDSDHLEDNGSKASLLLLEEARKDVQVEDCEERSIYLVTMLLLFYIPFFLAVYRGADLVANWLKCEQDDVAEHLVAVCCTGANLAAFLKYNSQEYFDTNVLKSSLISSYTLLILIFSGLCITSLKPYDNIFNVFSFVLVVAFIFIFCSGPQIITATLVLKYPRQSHRSRNIIFGCFFGMVLFIFVSVVLVQITLAMILNETPIEIVLSAFTICICAIVSLVFVCVSRNERKYNDARAFEDGGLPQSFSMETLTEENANYIGA